MKVSLAKRPKTGQTTCFHAWKKPDSFLLIHLEEEDKQRAEEELAGLTTTESDAQLEED